MKNVWFWKALAITAICAMVTITMVITRNEFCLLGLLTIVAVTESC